MFALRLLCAIAGMSLLAQAAPAPISRRSVSSSVLSELDLFSQWSTAAYCSSNFAATGTKLACPSGNCPRVQSANTETLAVFDYSDSFGDVTGFLAVDKTNDLIVLSFRGSSNLENWIADIDFPLTDISSVCSGCEGHEGFWDAWNGVSAALISAVNSAVSTYPSYTLVCTGHSYGAALTAIAATVFRNEGHTVQLYNYGQPRIGNLALATYITNQNKGANYRTTHLNDWVPMLPPKDLGFDHFSPEYWITSATNVSVTAADVTEVVGIDSEDGNDSDWLDPSTSAHDWYFHAISTC